MTSDTHFDAENSAKISRRAVTTAAVWTVPVIALAVAAPAAAASGSTASLTFSITPLVDVFAPFGTQTVVVTNTSTTDFSGPLTFSTPAWATTSAFTIAGATASGTTWTIPSASIAAGQSANFTLSWAAPYPVTAELQPLTLTVDPTQASVVPPSDPNVSSPYQLLWFAVTPGGQGNTAGTTSFFIGNTTPTDLNSLASTILGPVWTFPLPTVEPIKSLGVQYTGARIASGGKFVSRYIAPTVVAANGGKLDFTMAWAAIGGTVTVPQQARQLVSITTDLGVDLTPLGSETIYSVFRP